MRNSIINRLVKISAIALAAFFAAVSIPVFASAKTQGSADTVKAPAVANIAKVDFENRTLTAGTKIADSEIPLAAMPSEKTPDMTFQLIVISTALIVVSIVIFESRRISVNP